MKTQMLPLPLRRSRHTSPDTILVGASLDVSTARRFARAVARMASRRPPHVIVDMTNTQTVDSSGFGSLVSGLKKLAGADAMPVVVCANPTVRRLMDFAGVARMFTVTERLSDARRVLASAQASALAS